MVKSITMEELEYLNANENCEWVANFISDMEKDKWIKNGNFKWLKRELNLYEGLMYCCTKEIISGREGCWYYFIKLGDNMNSLRRIHTLFNNLRNNKKVLISMCKTDCYSDGGVVTGEAHSCLLF